MFKSTSLLSTLLLAVLVASNPVVVRDNLVRLSVAKRVNTTSAKDVLRIDQARAAALRARAARKNGIFSIFDEDASSISVTNQAVDYVASIGVGSPATTCMYFNFGLSGDLTKRNLDSLLIDTGSSNTWVGAGQSYVQTSTSQDTGDSVVRAFKEISLYFCLTLY